MNWRAIALIVATIVGVVAIAAWCRDGSETFNSGDFGGPYHLLYESARQKPKDFKEYKESKLFYSQAKDLSRDLLEDSIDRNRRDGYSRQRYNYAIDTDGHLLVGVWNDSKGFAGISCPGGGKLPLVAEDGFMIDWFPEDPKVKGAPLKDSPCWLTAASTDEAGKPIPPSNGVLDALSKHFMLVQGAGISISAFPDDPGDQAEWVETEVAYAGEILVEVSGECTYRYSVSNNSGTYRPEDRRTIREHVGEYFKEELGDLAPVAVNERLFDLDASGTYC